MRYFLVPLPIHKESHKIDDERSEFATRIDICEEFMTKKKVKNSTVWHRVDHTCGMWVTTLLWNEPVEFMQYLRI